MKKEKAHWPAWYARGKERKIFRDEAHYAAEGEGWIKASVANNLDRDNDGAAGGREPEEPILSFNELDPAVKQVAEIASVSLVSDEELRARIKEKTGRAPHPNTGREKLLEKLKDAE